MTQLKIAITGGIATGKSTVARMFEDMGALILDADQTARKAVEPESPCHGQLQALLGHDYFDASGSLIRPKLRAGIIQDSELRQKVNAVLHPFILSSMETAWKEHRKRDPSRLILFDIPLLFEIHFEPYFDRIILAYVPPAVQIRRLMQRDGLDHDQAVKTLDIQWPIDRKKEKSHIIIDNSGSREETLNQVRRIWGELMDSQDFTAARAAVSCPGR